MIERRSFCQDEAVHCGGLWEQLVSTGASTERGFRKLSTAQRLSSRPSIAVLTRPSPSSVIESPSDPAATHLNPRLPVPTRPSWYAHLSLSAPPPPWSTSVLSGTSRACVRCCTESLEGCSSTGTVESSPVGKQETRAWQRPTICSQAVTHTTLCYTNHCLTQLRTTVFSSSRFSRQCRCLDRLHHCSRCFS
jgi:hypothetical protein